ncbi:MAG: ABC transporter substrate-binding protein [Patescibacteria group bacterium]
MPIPDLKAEHKLLKNLFFKKWPSLKQIRYLPKILTKREKKIIQILSLVIAILIIILIVRLSQTNLKTIPTFGGHHIEGIIGQPQYVNPVLAKTNDVDLDLTKLIFSGLFKYNKNLQLVPDLVKNYEISSDKLTYKFELKDNIFWHNNVPLSADDILFTIKLVRNPEFNNPWFDYFKNVEIIKNSEKKFEIRLQGPNPNFLKYLTIGIIPKHIWQDIPVKQLYLSEYNLKPIGSGPFKFKSLIRDNKGLIKSYRLERNKNFYDKIPYLDSLTFQFYSNFENLIAAVRKREANAVYYAPKNLEKEFLATDFLKKYTFQLPYFTAIFFNLNTQNYLSSSTIRRVLAYATPKEKIINQVLFNEGQIIDGPILPHSFGYNPEIKKYEYNPDKAIKILENSGWQKNLDGYWQKNNKILEISLTTVQQSDLEKVGEIIQKSWQDLGIKTKLITVPAEIVQKEIITPRNYQALLYGIIESFESDPYLFWHSSQIKSPGLNLSGFNNKRVDELLEKAQTIPFDEAKKRKYLEFQNIIAEEVPAIFLYSTSYTYLVNKKIKGITIEKINIPSDRFNGVENWYIKTKKIRNNK